MDLYLYSTWWPLKVLYSRVFTFIHSYSASISSTLLFYEAQIRVQHLALLRFFGKTGNRTGWRMRMTTLPPQPQPPICHQTSVTRQDWRYDDHDSAKATDSNTLGKIVVWVNERVNDRCVLDLASLDGTRFQVNDCVKVMMCSSTKPSLQRSTFWVRKSLALLSLRLGVHSTDFINVGDHRHNDRFTMNRKEDGGCVRLFTCRCSVTTGQF